MTSGTVTKGATWTSCFTRDKDQASPYIETGWTWVQPVLKTKSTKHGNGRNWSTQRVQKNVVLPWKSNFGTWLVMCVTLNCKQDFFVHVDVKRIPQWLSVWCFSETFERRTHPYRFGSPNALTALTQGTSKQKFSWRPPDTRSHLGLSGLVFGKPGTFWQFFRFLSLKN